MYKISQYNIAFINFAFMFFLISISNRRNDILGRNGRRFRKWKVWHCHKKFLMFCLYVHLANEYLLCGVIISDLPSPQLVFQQLLVVLLHVGIWLVIGSKAFLEGQRDTETYGTYNRKEIQVGSCYRWLIFIISSLEDGMIYKMRYRVHPKGSGKSYGGDFQAMQPYTFMPLCVMFINAFVFYVYLRMKANATTLTTGNEYYLTPFPAESKTEFKIWNRYGLSFFSETEVKTYIPPIIEKQKNE